MNGKFILYSYTCGFNSKYSELPNFSALDDIVFWSVFTPMPTSDASKRKAESNVIIYGHIFPIDVHDSDYYSL